jgi:hypothetical protein
VYLYYVFCAERAAASERGPPRFNSVFCCAKRRNCSLMWLFDSTSVGRLLYSYLHSIVIIAIGIGYFLLLLTKLAPFPLIFTLFDSSKLMAFKKSNYWHENVKQNLFDNDITSFVCSLKIICTWDELTLQCCLPVQVHGLIRNCYCSFFFVSRLWSWTPFFLH